MNIKFNKFTGVKPVSKTLRNALIPTEFTMVNLERNGIISADELRAEKRQELKKIMDDYYRDLIERTLAENHSINWHILFELMKSKMHGDEKDTAKKLENEQKSKREEIHRLFAEQEEFGKIFSAKLVSDILPGFVASYAMYNDEDRTEKAEVVKLFNKFMSSFTEFFENRKNVFSKENISTSLCHRIVNDNALIFLNNMDSYKRIMENFKSESELVSKGLETMLGEWKISQIYSEDFFGMTMTQSGIEFYNDICGELNLVLNLYCQKSKKNSARFKMKRLHKQILCTGKSSFEISYKYDNDKDVYTSVNGFIKNIKNNNIIERLLKLGTETEQYDLNKIYISSQSYETVSIAIGGTWETIRNCLTSWYDDNIKGSGKAKENKIKAVVKADKYQSIARVDYLTETYNASGTDLQKAESYLSHIVQIIGDYEPEELYFDQSIHLIENGDKISEIKKILDIYIDVVHWIKTFEISESVEKEPEFYYELDDIYDKILDAVPLYNKVRNYVTQKPYNQEKFKLNFDSPTLANGWSKSKERDNNAIILSRDGKYYLGVFNVRNKPDKEILEGHSKPKNETDYAKMVYNLLPGASKMLPKVFLSKKGIDNFKPTDYILEGYIKKKHIKSSETFDIKYCRDLIDYFKNSISRHPEWKNFGFNFTETSKYNDISEFYKEVEKQGYKIEWTYITEEDINKLDEAGQIYLFQIFNKDFAVGSKGTPNLHTLYLKNLFSKENLDNVVLKLNGEAELFFRRSSIKTPVIHKKGSILVNRCYVDADDGKRKPIPEKEYMEIYNYCNGKRDTELSESARKYYNISQRYEATMDIVKDYRYSVDKLFIHLPITINFKATENKNVNDMVLEYIAKSDDIHIIGIDRGERNLIYVSVIDMHGHIVMQKSYNVVNEYDYKTKLKECEQGRDAARKNWKEIGKIKELKEGYLSMVIHEITQLIIEYNAIVMMEDLNFGFKRGRFKVERQVYQKFENMLINKLNYLVDKHKAVDEPGGLLNGYQLTYIPDRMSELGRQCGIIFYVPAAYTSKIDPTTGFFNAFRFNLLTSAESRRDFLNRFKCIKYNGSMNMFEFDFDYNDFITHNTTIARTQWKVFTNGGRIKNIISKSGWNGTKKIDDITALMKEIFDSRKIDFSDGGNLLPEILAYEGADKDKFIVELLDIFKLTVQLRNSMPDGSDIEYDRIISPVINENNTFYDSDMYTEPNSPLPIDADANGAYCIALKGLYEVNQIKENWKEGETFPKSVLKLNNANWFDFVQNKRYE